MDIYTYPHRRYLVEYQYPRLEVKHADITIPTVCTCGAALPTPRESWVRNRECDSGGLSTICSNPDCGRQWWQVIDRARE